VPVLTPLVGVLGGPAVGLGTTTAYAWSYDIGTIIFLLTVGLLSWSHRRAVHESCVISGRRVRGQQAYEHRIRTAFHTVQLRTSDVVAGRDPGVAGSFAFAGATTDFVVTPVSSTVVDLTPQV